MADDIDDLLDEVENKFCAPKQRKHDKPQPRLNVTSRSNSNVGRKGMDEDLNAMIDDICDVPEPFEKNIYQPQNVNENKKKGQLKCFPVYLGGCACPTGHGSTINKRACDNLRCTDCDFKVATFDNYSWDTTTDYLFLRNNAPDFYKLKAKLCPKKGYRSYCCQCKWNSVKELVDIQSQTGVKWVCGKH